MPTLILGKDYLITFIDHLDTKTGDVIYKKSTEGEYIHKQVMFNYQHSKLI